MRELELCAARWLLYKRKCPMVLNERTPRYGNGLPDVLGISKSRHLIEVEVKRSMADFRANSQKHHIQYRERAGSEVFDERFPKQFWFIVPAKIVEKAQAELPSYAGLLVPCVGLYADVVTEAPNNGKSKKLSAKEIGKLMRCAGNQIAAMMLREYLKREASDGVDMDAFCERQARYLKVDYCNFQI